MIPPVQRKPKEWVLAKPEPAPKAARKTKAKKTAVVAEPDGEVTQTDEPTEVTKPTQSDKAESESTESKESGDAGSE